MPDAVEEHRESLEALAERDDLNCSKYARALLDAVESEG
jgi:DNA-binding GntR family transcriptional regulator